MKNNQMNKTILNLAFFTSFYSTAQTAGKMNATSNSKTIVKDFLLTVRAGKNPERVKEFMADTVLAHQINSENPVTVKRTPQNYADHVEAFLEAYGKFQFEITELIAENEKVYARWKQTGKHQTEIDGHPATGKELIEYASAVYRLEKGKIVEYWIQIDRLGFDEQLKSSK